MSESTDLAAEASLTGVDDHASIPFQPIKNTQSEPISRSAEGGGGELSPPRFRRRHTLVNYGHQLRFTSVLLVQMTVVMLTIGCFAYVESQQTMSLVLKRLLDFPLRTHQLHLANQDFLFRIMMVIGLAAVVQICFGIYMSHKVAGPVVKMSAMLERTVSGDYSQRVQFRDGDQLEELALATNRMLDNFSSEQERTHRELEEVAVQLEQLKASPGNDELVEQLRQRLARLAGIESPRVASTREG